MQTRPIRLLAPFIAGALLAACGGDEETTIVTGPTVVSAAGDRVADTVAEFRSMVGNPDNGGEPGAHAGGRREINWDGVPDEFSAPNFLPSDFFNAASAPRARGAFYTTPGDGVQVSADSDNPSGAAVRFGNINPSYAESFVAFSEERLFSPIGSNVIDLTFLVPGTDTPALVNGFGAVYTDVDTAESSFEYFDGNNHSLGRFVVPAKDNGNSFLGVIFDRPVVARVHIVYGNSALGPNESATVDVAVMDNFIYGEPQPASE